MDTMMIHRVADVKLGEVTKGETSGGTYWVRDIVITKEDGSTVVLNLFGDNEDALCL